MVNKWRCYIKPFNELGVYQDWIEVTRDVCFDQMGNISADLDNTEYDIGVYRTSSFKITLRNDHGIYSDVGSPKSIFAYTRSNSQFKITWEIDEDGPYCGTVYADQFYLSEETTIFTGLLNDESLKMDLGDQKVGFQVLGRESVFLNTIVPFGSISNGDDLSEMIYTLLNQSSITALLTVSMGNITVGLDQANDSIASLQNKTVQEGLNKLLLASNSVLYIENDAVIVAPRTASADVEYTFYGQASTNGRENIQDIKAIKNGQGKLFNYFLWKDTTVVSQDTTSVSKYGIRKKEVSFDFITNGTKQGLVLDALLDEFLDPKQEFDLYTDLNYQTLAVPLLGKVSIDYPISYVPGADPLPICGVAICGEAVLPKGLWSFNVIPTDYYKVIGRSIDVDTAIVKFKVRAV